MEVDPFSLKNIEIVGMDIGFDYDYSKDFDTRDMPNTFDTIDFLEQLSDDEKITCGSAITHTLSDEEYDEKFMEFMNGRRNT